MAGPPAKIDKRIYRIAVMLVLAACADDAKDLEDSSVARDAATADEEPRPVLTTWSTAAAMPGVPIAYPNVVALDGTLWVVGGRTLNAGDMTAAPIASVHAYDPETDRWTSHPDMPEAFDLPNVAAAGGKLWILGARGTRGVFSYEPKSRVWSQHGERPGPRGIGASAVAVTGKRIYVIGGVVASATNPRGQRVPDAAMFDTATRAWQTLPPLPEESAYFGAGIHAGVLYANGGSTDSGEVARPGQTFALDLESATWSEKAPAPKPISSFGVAMLDARLYALGGITGATGMINAESFVYEVATDSWSTTTPLLTPRFSGGAAALDGQIYVAAGVKQISDTEFAGSTILEILGP